MTAPTLTAPAFFMPGCPTWCVEDNIPDPGVVVHCSRIWQGSDYYEGATWRIQVTQYVSEVDGPDMADININEGEGVYRSVAEFGRALLLAEALKNSINADRQGS
ncbi:hypothetical protein [Micromonospora wenchangensis]|uniref:hypothetical protein n=1 Tax=Micromonospora wenchangensis TaxID=1185415 RepID=UPI0038021331